MAKEKDTIVKLPPFTASLQIMKSGQNTDWSHDYYNILKIHEKGKRGKNIKIAILDTGVDLSHDSFDKAISEGRLKSVDARKGKNSPSDLNGHGTWCVSRYISDGRDVLGFAPDATVISYKVLNDNGSGNLSDVIRGIRMAIDAKVDYISTSLGWDVDVLNFKGLTKEVEEAGIIWFSAAGNDGSKEDLDYPAKYDRVISVGSHNNKGLRSSFSDFGIDLDVYSSGENVRGAYTQNREAYLSGTSMSTPSFGALLATIHSDVVKEYGKIDREILKKIVKCH